MADVKVLLLLFCTVCSLSAALDDDFRGSSHPVDPEEGELGEAVGQVGEEAPHDHSLDEEALFSPEGKKKLYKLPPEEAKKELKRLIDRIDRDGNGELSREEMILQLELVDQGYFRQDLEQQWPQVDLDGDGYVTREEYAQSMGEGADFLAGDMEGTIDREENADRFKQADVDGDGRLSKAEFDALLHPDLHEHMIQHLIEDHLRQHDADHDGFISFDEYMAIYARAMEGGQMPDWVQQEKREFEEVFDKNRDGKLDREEMKDWIAPSSALYAADEADHILRDADKNKDGVLTMEEIMDKFELFRDSELTDVWHVGHDEL